MTAPVVADTFHFSAYCAAGEGAVFALVCTDQPTHSGSADARITALTVGVGAGEPSTLSALALAIQSAHSRPFGRF
jgi:hypothetical protein